MGSFNLLNIKLHLLFVSIRICFQVEDSSSVDSPGIMSLAWSNKNLVVFTNLGGFQSIKSNVRPILTFLTDSLIIKV